MTVCTGNICRSPLAQVLLATRLADLQPSVYSAGVRGLNQAPMTPEAIDLALDLGVSEETADAHRSRFLTEGMLVAPDLILAMTRDHRRSIAELAPSRLRSTFTAREFARLAAAVSDEEIVAAATSVGPDATDGERVRAALAAVAAHRGLVPPPDDPADDDVIDPYRRDWATYQLSAQQLLPGIEAVERVIRLATSGR